MLVLFQKIHISRALAHAHAHAHTCQAHYHSAHLFTLDNVPTQWQMKQELYFSSGFLNISDRYLKLNWSKHTLFSVLTALMCSVWECWVAKAFLLNILVNVSSNPNTYIFSTVTVRHYRIEVVVSTWMIVRRRFELVFTESLNVKQ